MLFKFQNMDPERFPYILDAITAVTFTVQIYVFYLIIYKTPSSTQQYRYFLYLFTVSVYYDYSKVLFFQFADFAFTFVLDLVAAPNAIIGSFGANLKAVGKYLSPNGQRVVVELVLIKN